MYRFSLRCPQQFVLLCRGSSCDLLGADDVSELLFYFQEDTFELQTITLRQSEVQQHPLIHLKQMDFEDEFVVPFVQGAHRHLFAAGEFEPKCQAVTGVAQSS